MQILLSVRPDDAAALTSLVGWLESRGYVFFHLNALRRLSRLQGENASVGSRLAVLENRWLLR